jgi:hypothetical protein
MMGILKSYKDDIGKRSKSSKQQHGHLKKL